MKNFLLSLPAEFRKRFNTVDPSRNAAIDVMRCLCILYIVGFFHLWDYAVEAPSHQNALTFCLSFAVLGLFVLISGYLIGAKDLHLTKDDIRDFYFSRIVRIFPPFLLAVLLFALIGISNLDTLARSIPLLSMLYGPAPSTLWFIIMLFNFYLLAPVLIAARHHGTVKYLGTAAIIFAALLSFEVWTRHADMRLVVYFPAFAAGIFLARNEKIFGRNAVPILTVLTSASLLLIQFHGVAAAKSLAIAPFVTFCSLLIFTLVMKRQEFFHPTRLLAFVSAASYFMYLFHRPVYATFSHFFLPDSGAEQVLFLIGLCLPVVIVFSWLGQTTLDAAIRRYLSYEKYGF